MCCQHWTESEQFEVLTFCNLKNFYMIQLIMWQHIINLAMLNFPARVSIARRQVGLQLTRDFGFRFANMSGKFKAKLLRVRLRTVHPVSFSNGLNELQIKLQEFRIPS